MQNQPIGTLPASAMYDQQGLLNTGNQYPGSTGANQRISYVNTLSDNYYSRNGMQGANKRQDYKVNYSVTIIVKKLRFVPRLILIANHLVV